MNNKKSVDLPKLRSIIREELSEEKELHELDQLREIVKDLSLDIKRMIEVNLDLQGKIAELMISITSLIKTQNEMTELLKEASEEQFMDVAEEIPEQSAAMQSPEQHGAVSKMIEQNKEMIESMQGLEKYIKRLYRKDILEKIKKKRNE
jgi:hypothetical protein